MSGRNYEYPCSIVLSQSPAQVSFRRLDWWKERLAKSQVVVFDLASSLLSGAADGRRLPDVFLAPLLREKDARPICEVLRPFAWGGLLVEVHPYQAQERERKDWFGAFQWECLAGLGIGRRLVTGLRHAQDWPEGHLSDLLGLLCGDFKVS